MLDQVITYEDALKNDDGISIKCNGKNLSNSIRCHCIKRISLLLITHQKNINIFNHGKTVDVENVMIMIRDTFGEHYDIVTILNDYMHIVKYHDDILEDITKFINIKIQCNLVNCGCITRNYRNRVNDDDNYNDNDKEKKIMMIRKILHN